VTCHRFGFHSGIPGKGAGIVTPAVAEKESGDKSPHSTMRAKLGRALLPVIRAGGQQCPAWQEGGV
jgi:hypothetical protein